ncbi:transcriptional regulator, LysR family [Streptantibioticus cattleyicolor NRRL 8057 = DSM 46488]|uniref:Transcriptional regulator, LysR family n=1 Tax=Streptantibioticus cattleyicolor (strain ATCC 35852 / DSM 46488 / JCM 4925 / NBRC 14057 / NRRL 8057) TaxID=1003195 RepID=G8WXX9_STREN|nr:LysR substrate-binding domain-containing protein [Streptantibioticus cattleyicolor]AEW97279.1 transcriptional regulator, LysR family [Streptantibioticus cattleyicolor NRRL 8057 = DSM 46488]MYS61732.1 LysR family transcriptional regulator [Streptomyces sp. SID5468]
MGQVFDPTQLRTFLAVAQTLSFTQAAHRLGVRQSTVSQHVRKLEEAAGRQLFVRDTHGVALTEDGEAMLGFARTIVAANVRAAEFFAGTRLRGRLRFGASEDFVLTRLPEVLEGFRRDHPEVDLELTVELSGTLHRQLAEGRLDLVLGKRSTGAEPGRLVWRDRLAWIGGAGLRLDPERPVPLIVYPPPSITRARALEVLEQAGRPWHIVCTSRSLSGVRAAALAGLGVVPHAEGLVPPGLRPLPARSFLPELGGVEFVLLRGRARSAAPEAMAAQQAADALSRAILAAGDRLHARPPLTTAR